MKNKGYLLAGLIALLAIVGHVSGFNQYVVTKFNDVQVEDLKLNNNHILDSSATTRITVGSTNVITGNLTVTGTFTPPIVSVATMTITGTQGLRTTAFISSAATTVPIAAGILAFDSSYILYVSTGTGAGAWVKIGGQ